MIKSLQTSGGTVLSTDWNDVKNKDYEGKGLMQDALKVVIDYAFEDLMLHRLEASTLLDNFRSQKTLELQGFKKVGLNEKYLFINGEWRDHYTFFLIKK